MNKARDCLPNEMRQLTFLGNENLFVLKCDLHMCRSGGGGSDRDPNNSFSQSSLSLSYCLSLRASFPGDRPMSSSCVI